MKKKLLIILGILVAIISTSAVGYAIAKKNEPQHPSEYHIGITYQDAIESEKPMVALFYADWCGYCLKFMPTYSVLSRIYKDKYNFVMLNVEDEDNQDLIKDVGLAGYPTVYIFDPKYDNRVCLSNAIYHDLKKFRKELDRFLRIRALLDSK